MRPEYDGCDASVVVPLLKLYAPPFHTMSASAMRHATELPKSTVAR
jgi:hypothetical protein